MKFLISAAGTGGHSRNGFRRAAVASQAGHVFRDSLVHTLLADR